MKPKYIYQNWSAKIHLSKLVSQNQAFINAKSGKPVAQVLPYAPKSPRRIGFMPMSVPNDFDRLGKDAIETMFDSTNE
ncbi:hypothetical protein KTH71_10525 [Acinetobacter sp. WU_MDCI_Axc73]|nr:hypothetical protein [Acinetobacter sp. WU_MDCI_Axc73]